MQDLVLPLQSWRPGFSISWLQLHQSNLDAAGVTDLRPDAFIPRLVFGDYIQDLLREACETSKCLDLIHDEIVDITRLNDETFQLFDPRKAKV